MNPATRMLFQMAEARRFNRWMADIIAHHVRGAVLEIGAGIGNLTEYLRTEAESYVAMDTDREQLAELARFPEVKVLYGDAADPRCFESLHQQFDTVVCLNVLEHIPNDRATLANIHAALQPDGKAIVLVPQCPIAFGSLDQVLEHQRRYTKEEFEEKLLTAGFIIERLFPFNRATFPGWLLNSKILRRRTLSSTQLRAFDALVPAWRRVDRFLPWPATSLIAVARVAP